MPYNHISCELSRRKMSKFGYNPQNFQDKSIVTTWGNYSNIYSETKTRNSIIMI